MALKATKSNFKLTTDNSKKSSYPTVSLTTVNDTVNLNSEDRSTSENPEASRKFARLSEQGLNPLKPVIIANTEFIPVSDGSSPDSSGLKAQFGENNVISVNNVVKLFEIHRQVRKATLNSANQLLKNFKSYNPEDVLTKIKEYVSLNFDTLAKSNLSSTVSEVINKLSNYSPISSTSSGSKKSISSTFKNDNKKTISISDLDSAAPDANLRSVFKQNSEDPFLNSLVEYAIIELVLYDAIEYLGGILTIKDAAERSWSISEVISFSNPGDIDTSGLDSGVKKIFDEVFSTFSTRGSFGRSIDNILKNYISITPESTTTDMSVFVQVFLYAFSRLNLSQGCTYDSDIPPAITNSPLLFPEEDKNTINALNDLRNIWASSLYASMKLKNNYVELKNNQNLAELDISNNDGALFKRDSIKKIINNYSENTSDIEVFADLFSASIFNDIFAINFYTASSDKKNSAFVNLPGVGIPISLNSFYDYFGSLLGISDFEDENYSFNIFNPRQTQKLISSFSTKSSNSEDLSDHIPLESTSNFLEQEYLTGPEYFYNIALERGDESFSDLKDFTTNYKNFTNAYASDIYNLTKIDLVETAAKNILLKIGEDISGAISGHESTFLLSLIADQSNSYEGLIRLFRSAYFGSLLNEAKGSDGDGIGRKQTAIFISDGTVSDEGARRTMRFANQILIKNFIEKTLGVNNIKTERKKSVRNESGNRDPESINPKKYTSKDEDFSIIKNEKTINEGTGKSNNKKQVYSVYRKRSSSPSEGLNKEEVALEGGASFSINAVPGLSIKYYSNNEFLIDSSIASSSQVKSFNAQRKILKGDIETHLFESQGSSLSLSSHHRAFLMYSWVAKILSKSISLSAKSSKDSTGVKINLTLNTDEIEGVAEAFKSFSPDASSNKDTSGWSEAKIVAYDNTYEEISKFLSFVEKRKKSIASAVILPVIHSQLLYNQYKKSKDFISSGGNSNRNKIVVDILKNSKINAYENVLDLLSKEGISQSFKAYTETILRKESLYTREDIPSLEKMKLTIKTLSNSGYGMLSSEKRGPKTVHHVGVTNSLLSTLRIEAYKDFNNKDFLESSLFCVNVFKRNEIDSQILVYPKTFLFDSSLQILDCDKNGESLNHIKNYSDNWSVSNILENIEFTRFTNQTTINGNPFNNIKGSFYPEIIKSSDLLLEGDSTKIKQLLMNHLNDYALKSYYKFSLGLDLNEYNFSLTTTDFNLSEISGGIVTPLQDLQADYENMLNQIITLYPAAGIDKDLENELIRNIQIMRANVVYSLTDKVKRVLYPNKFDRILSILVNEKDFILYTPAYNVEFEDVYGQTPSFVFDSRISRPNTVAKGSDIKNINVLKYKKSCNESFPEVFSTYVTITVLPKGSI